MTKTRTRSSRLASVGTALIVVASLASAWGPDDARAATVARGLAVRAESTMVRALSATRPRTRRKVPKRHGSARSSRRAAGAAVAWTSTRSASALSTSLGSILGSHTRSGQWGVLVVSLTRGDTLFEQNPDAPMQPASTMKMFTSSLALDHFGPDHRFTTPVLRDGQVGPDGVLQGNLYIRGTGDPSLTPRFWRDTAPMDVLARQIAAAGIKHVHGDIVADASAFDERRIPEGWQSRYLGAAYAARVSPLSLNENLVWVVVQPAGRTASVTLDPATTTIPVQSSVSVSGGRGGRISAVRRPDGSIMVRGSIGSQSGPLRYSLVVDDPPSFVGGALQAALVKAGVAVDGHVRLGTTPANATQVAAIASPPLAEIVTDMNRESINIFAELLFRAAAHDMSETHVGSAETGLTSLRSFLSQRVGARADAVDVSDGSGLSVLDRVTPRSMVQLLSYAHRSPWGTTFHASLPLEGESGTLRRHGRYTPAHGNLHAKTGTTNTVASLGGYVTARDGEIIAFSFIYNGADRWNAKTTMDQMGATLADFVRE